MARSSFTQTGVVDDRGRTVPVLDAAGTRPTSFAYTGVSGDKKTPADRRARQLMWQIAQRNATDRPAHRIAEGVVFVVLFAALLWPGWQSGVRAGLVWTLVLAGIIATAWPILRWSDRRTHRRAMARLAGLPFVCLACGYSLKGIDPDPDGCTVCPECGGAWRRPQEVSG